MNAALRVSHQVQSIAFALDKLLEELAGEPVEWFLLIYTVPRANYCCSARTRDHGQAMVEEIITRWQTDDPRANLRVTVGGGGNPPPTQRFWKLLPESGALLDALDKMLRRIAGEPVAFSLLIGDPPNPVIYLAKAAREQVRPELERLLAMWRAGMPDVPAHEVM